jgi:glycosidase
MQMTSIDPLEQIRKTLDRLFPQGQADTTCQALKGLMDKYSGDETILRKRRKYRDQLVLNEKDAFLITYADTIQKEGEKPLRTLGRFLNDHVKDAVTGIHLLPFFPSTSDGGYAIVDYKAVDPGLGTWDDIEALSSQYRLMVDFVINHVSSKCEWFTRFLGGDPGYQDYFIWADEDVEMPEVFRPRAAPLFTRFETPAGEKYVWTTFSEDQVDLNLKNPEVLLKVFDAFLFYLTKGVEVIRLDAIGYVWKEPHTSCVNLPQTHEIVRLFRYVLDYTAPYAAILTEANFPDSENIAYFGKGHQASMVYNFSLPPLVIDAFARKDISYIMEETNNLGQEFLFFDFLASHDGVGLLGAKETLDKMDFENLIRLTKTHNGLISYKATNHGPEPYELNINYFDAICDPNLPVDPLTVKKFIASQAVMLFLKGIPGIYIHSFLGSRNYLKGVEASGINRMINRERLDEESVYATLSQADSLRSQVLDGYLRLLKKRKEIPAFHPSGEKEVIDFIDKRLLVIERRFEDETITVIINVSEDVIWAETCKGRLVLGSNKLFDGKVAPYGVYLLWPSTSVSSLAS